MHSPNIRCITSIFHCHCVLYAQQQQQQRHQLVTGKIMKERTACNKSRTSVKREWQGLICTEHRMSDGRAYGSSREMSAVAVGRWKKKITLALTNASKHTTRHNRWIYTSVSAQWTSERASCASGSDVITIDFRPCQAKEMQRSSTVHALHLVCLLSVAASSLFPAAAAVMWL